MKKVFKFGTGQEIPKGAIYLGTIANEKMVDEDGQQYRADEKKYVWHYFLVEVKK